MENTNRPLDEDDSRLNSVGDSSDSFTESFASTPKASLPGLTSRSRSASTTRSSFNKLPPIPKVPAVRVKLDLAAVSAKLDHSVFMSYCWRNSRLAVEAGQVSEADANIGGCDPRDLARRLTEDKIITFLDVNRFKEGDDLDAAMKQNITAVGAQEGIQPDEKHSALIGNHYRIDTTKDKKGFYSGTYIRIRDNIRTKLHEVSSKNDSRAAADGNRDALFTYGRHLLDNGEPENGVKMIEMAAEQGNIEAKFGLATLYQEGAKKIGISKNANKAMRWFEELAESGNFRGQLGLAELYHDGEGINVDFNKALYYANLAASQNCADAHQLLGDMYLNGRGITKSADQAFSHYFKSAKLNNTDAGCVNKESEQIKTHYLQWQLGMMFYTGEGIKQEIEKGIRHITMAAEGSDGSPEAQFTLGVIYKNGYGVTQNTKLAFDWFLKAANQGFESAQHTVSLMYQWGDGVEKNVEKAKHWQHKMLEHQILDDQELPPPISDSLADLFSMR
ncbi:HCP-like protein [Rhizoclosmatium globosum]|uniref:HCP-like protein n=1 Tax=Rhizoclosmatium globosum TaxID=329046 RepID=A0A1Y2D1L3_9FUNG|nr:HCP-like protein [Rhizoclosmatium globosum]|eukprot:ORY53168.1 HCP-like protein [Rhizoclosmatium globosum]